MQALRGVIASFRSVQSVEGLSAAGSIGLEQFFCQRSLWAHCLQHTHVNGGQTSTLPAQLITARLQQFTTLARTRALSKQVNAGQRTAASQGVQPSSWHCRAWSLIQRHQFRTQQPTKSMWQRDYYSSPYSRSYGGAWYGDKVLYGLIAANCVGFLLWQSNPGLMAKQATVSINSIREGRLHTLLTSAFSHASPNHLFANMFTFYFFGREIGRTFGGKKLLALYAAGAVAGSAAHVIFSWAQARFSSAVPWVREANMARSPPALGASAAVNAVVLLTILLNPYSTVYIYAVLPVPAALLGLLYIGGDMFGVLGGHGGNVAYAGHLGGAAVGALAFLALRRGRIRW